MELFIAWLIHIPIQPILLLLFLIGLGIGVFFILKPSLAIEMQRRFYAKINWRIEPISMHKELRNTRLMGVFIITCLLAALFFIFANSPIVLF